MTGIPVCTVDRRYRAAIAELAPSARQATGPEGAICVVDGRGMWWEESEYLVAGGAAALVVSEPDPAPDDALQWLSALPLPVAVSRPRLRPDVVADATAGCRGVSLVVADAFSPRGTARAVARDSIGWIRELGRESLRVVHVAGSRGGIIAAFEGEGGVAATLTLGIGGGGTQPALNAVSIGTQRVEFRMDEASGSLGIVVAMTDGRFTPTPRRESLERLALRRVCRALAGDGTVINDAGALRHDDNMATIVLAELRP